MPIATTLTSWLLGLHLLSVFALTGGVILFWILVIASRSVAAPQTTISYGRVADVGNKVVVPGSIGTVVFGIWLAIRLDDVQVWDGWVLIAIALWAVAAVAGQRSGAEYAKATRKAEELERAGQSGPSDELLALNRTSRGLWLHSIATAALFLVLVDVLWKPGASELVGVFPRASEFDINFPLLVHITGAMVLIGGVLTAAGAFLTAGGDVGRLRLGFYALLFAALPGLMVAKLGATWIWSKESAHGFIGSAFPHSNDPRWIEIGGTALDGGAGLLVAALILGWFGLKRLDGHAGDFLTRVPVVRNMSGTTLLRGTTIISVVLLAGYALAIWAMSTKPG